MKLAIFNIIALSINGVIGETKFGIIKLNDGPKFVGEIDNKAHGIGGTVYIAGERILLVKNFTYDGTGPDAFFLAGTDGSPSGKGTILPHPFNGTFYSYENEAAPILTERFTGNKDITLATPETLKTDQILWLSVWCRKYAIDFGSFYFTSHNDIADAESEPETKPEAESEPETKPEAEYEPESKPVTKAESEPEAGVSPETEPLSEYGSANALSFSLMFIITNIVLALIGNLVV